MNNFNGIYLNYFIDIKLYEYIKSYFKTNAIYLYTNKNKLPQLYLPNNQYILPIGLFSNSGFILDCYWKNTSRNFNQLMPNYDIISHNIILTDVQKYIIEEYNKNVDIIQTINKAPIYVNLVGQCSVGKTVLAIYLMTLYKFKTFIITPSIELTKQWKKEITKFLNNIKCYESLNGVKSLLKIDKDELLSYDIICIPYKHLSNGKFNQFLVENFSMGIIDEQHIYNLETNDVLQKFFTFYSYPIFISLTATPRPKNSFYLGREINLDLIVNKYKPKKFKQIAYEISTNSFLNNIKELSKYSDIKPEYYSQYKILKKKKVITRQDAYILSNSKKRAVSHDPYRINIICNQIITTFLNNENIKNPKILILTKFIEEIQMYYSRLIEKIDPKCIFCIYAKGTKNDNTILSNVKKNIENMDRYILIGTEDQLGTGIDIIDLNILHLVSIPTNKRNIIQYAGRVSRDNDTNIHNIYYYNINNLPDLSIETEITNIRETLINKNWNCIFTKYI